MDIELRLFAFTVSGVLAEVDSKVAEMFAVPAFLAVTRPLTVMEATEDEDELQPTTLVTFWVVPSEKVAVAVYCWLTSSDKLAFAGEMAIDVDIAEVTVNDAVPEMEPEVAVMATVPAATPRDNPFVGDVSFTVATAVFEELQSTLDVRFCVLLSVYVPVAMNC